MKVKIVKCSNEAYWYKNLIGMTVEVENIPEYYRHVDSWSFMINDDYNSGNYIVVSDCIPYEEQKQSQTNYEEEIKFLKNQIKYLEQKIDSIPYLTTYPINNDEIELPSRPSKSSIRLKYGINPIFNNKNTEDENT